jgi:hypothetical protein
MSVLSALHILEVLYKLFVAKDFTGRQVSDLVHALLHCPDYLPSLLGGKLVVAVDFNDCPYGSLTSFHDVKAVGLSILVIDDVTGVKPLFAEDVVELKHPVEAEFVEELALRKEFLSVA